MYERTDYNPNYRKALLLKRLRQLKKDKLNKSDSHTAVIYGEY